MEMEEYTVVLLPKTGQGIEIACYSTSIFGAIQGAKETLHENYPDVSIDDIVGITAKIDV